jgi:hypothetical protein
MYSKRSHQLVSLFVCHILHVKSRAGSSLGTKRYIYALGSVPTRQNSRNSALVYCEPIQAHMLNCIFSSLLQNCTLHISRHIWLAVKFRFSFLIPTMLLLSREIIHCDLKPENVMLKNMTSPQVRSLLCTCTPIIAHARACHSCNAPCISCHVLTFSCHTDQSHRPGLSLLREPCSIHVHSVKILQVAIHLPFLEGTLHSCGYITRSFVLVYS